MRRLRPSQSLPLKWVAPLLVFVIASSPGGSSGVASAAEPVEEQEGSRRIEGIFQDVQEVNVVNIDVIVTDAEGKAVSGLTALDFELREGGKPVVLTNFYAVEGGEPIRPEVEGEPPASLLGASAGAQAPATQATGVSDSGLHLVVFVDNANISTINRARVLERLKRYLEERWRPGFEVTLVSNDRALTIRQAPTGRRDQIIKAFDALELAGSRSARLDRDLDALLRAMERVNVDAAIPSLAVKGGGEFGGLGGGEDENPFGDVGSDQTQEEMTARVAAEVVALVPQISAYAQLKADEVRASLRVLERLVESVAGLPGRKAVLYVGDGLSANPAEALAESFDARFSAVGDIPSTISLRSETARFDLTPDLERLISFANASRVSFYTLDASPPASVQRGGADRATNFVTNLFASTEERNEQESLRLMARSTGGLTSLSRSSLDQVLESFFHDFENYYSLGYTSDREEGERKIEVRLRQSRKGVEVRHRTAVRDRSLDERMAERTLSALLLESLENPLGVRLESEAMQPGEDGTFMVPVIVRIPLGKLVLVPGAREHQARVSLYIAVQDELGRTSEVVKQACPIHIPNSELLIALGRQAGCGVRLRMRSGEQRVAVGVRDDLASVVSAVQLRLEVGERDEGDAPETDSSRPSEGASR